MKLVIFGLTISSSWGNGHATPWRSLCRALASRGHTIVFFEHDVPYYAAHRDFNEFHGIELILYTSWSETARNAKAHLADADVAMVTSYCYDACQATDLILSSRARLRVFYDLDAPVTLDKLTRTEPVDYIGPCGLCNFDLVLSFTGGRTLQELQSRLGATRVAALYGSVDPEVHRTVQPIESYRADLSYLGTYAEDRQNVLCELFTEPARRLPARRFCIGGSQYPQAFPWTKNIWFVHHVPPSDHSAFYSSSRITLNVTRRAMATMGFCPSGRLFEAAACATPILSDWWEGLDQFFEPSKEILVARAAEDTVSALENLSEEELKQIGQRARTRVMDQHTGDRRARDFEQIIEWATKPESNSKAFDQLCGG